MKVEKIDGSVQRRVLIGMITDRSVLARIAAKWKSNDGLFHSQHENMIASWCVGHFKEYNKAPGKDIEHVFGAWSANRDSDDTVKMIDKFLASISEEYESNGVGSSEYLIDIAGRHFRKVSLKKLVAQAEADLDADAVDDADEKISKHRRVDLGVGAIADGLEYEPWAKAYEGVSSNVLIEYPGELGEFIGNEFARGSFVAIMASSKRGKTWWLVDLAYRGMKKNRKVAYFEAGDLTLDQLYLRFGTRVLRRPRHSQTIRKPTSYESVKDGPVVDELFVEGATPNEVFKEWQKVTQGDQRIRMSCYSNGTLTMAAMDSTLKEWAKDGWVADVVVIDYADLLAPPIGVPVNDREGINENWKYMRRISQDLHCLVVTATQADAESYDRKTLTRRNFSGDRRKHDHVTAMLALNATDEDKKQGVTRVNFLDRRDAEYTEMAQVYVAGCLAIGCPVIKSTRWKKEEE